MTYNVFGGTLNPTLLLLLFAFNFSYQLPTCNGTKYPFCADFTALILHHFLYSLFVIDYLYSFLLS